MKFLLNSLLLIFSVLTFAQVQHISELSTGKIENVSTLLDNQSNVIGYVFIYNNGLTTDSKNVNYEFVMLDSNLNKLVNGDFQLLYHKKIEVTLLNIKFNNSKLYFNFNYHVNNGLSYYPYAYHNIVIDLKTKNVVQNKLIRDFEILDNLDGEELVKLKSLKPANYRNLFTTTNGNSVNFHNYKTGNTFLMSRKYDDYVLYDEQLNPIFEKKMPKSTISKYSILKMLDTDVDRTMYYSTILESTGLGMKKVVDTISIFNTKSKSLDFQIAFNDTVNNTYSFPQADFIKDKIVITSELKNYEKMFSRTPETIVSVGLRRSIFDFNGNSISDKSIMYENLFKDLGILEKKDKNGFFLEMKENFNFDDGSFIILYEKAKGNILTNTYKTENYIVANFDKDANLINYEVINKARAKMSDRYLFSQINQEEKAVIFFYEEMMYLNNKPEYYLVVNKFKDSKLTREMIPVKTELSKLGFSMAKYGHVLITEFDKKNKETTIRLEKINL